MQNGTHNRPLIGLIHPTGNPFAHQAAQALAELGVLAGIITGIAYNPQAPLAQALQRLAPALDRELARRRWLPPRGIKIHSYPLREILRIVLLRGRIPQRLGYSPQGLTDWVYRSLDRTVARRHLQRWQGVYGYEDGAATMFERAKGQGKLCIYDLPIVYYRHSQAIQQREGDRFPALAPALLSLREPPAKLARKDQELQLADRIIVPSTVVKASLAPTGIPSERITVIPFGAPSETFTPSIRERETLRVLFVGRVGPRKGVHYLLEAWRSLSYPDAELHLIGINEFPPGWLPPGNPQIHYHGSIPHAQLLPHYQRASLFVFPSLIEGVALVQLEAMACGLPILTTANAGATDIITDGVEGWIIPAGDVGALVAKLDWAHGHPEELQRMGQAARQRAEVLTWQRYREGLKQALAPHLFTEPSGN
ncbi:MAG: glycosyltransferase family 1 protein [Spirulina sp. DLM2.Bin59]|nr:MAG: glycosyltransferase family 1 protein [Spirulina sp. DLM2.Bin59]